MPAIPRPRAAGLFSATALFAILLISLTVWVSVAGVASRKIGSNEVVPPAAPSAQPDTGPAPTPEPAGLPAVSAAKDTVPPSQTLLPVANNITRDVGRPKPPAVLTKPFVVSADNYTVRSGERFAEIRVHRSSRLDSDTPFVWWTEAASAKPGVDYVHQGKAIQSFRKGRDSTSFFVKLVPTASRTQPEVFYIAIAAAGRGASSGQIARAAVWLPTYHNQS